MSWRKVEANVRIEVLIEESTNETIIITRTHRSRGYRCSRSRSRGHREACYSLRLLKNVCGYKMNNVQSSQKVVLGNDRKKRQRRFTKNKRHIPIASASFSPPSLSSSQLETLVFMTGSSSESSRTSLNPLSEDKSTSSPWVAELGMEEGVTTKEESSFTA